MSEHDPLLGLGGLIDEPVSPRPAFAEALRAQLVAELASDERTAEKERKMTNLAAPAVIVRFPERAKRTRRQRLMKVFEIAVVAAIAIGLIAALSSGRWDRTDSPTPASNSIQVMAPIGTPSPVASPNAATGLLWRVDPPEDSKDLFRIAAANGTLYRVMSDAYGSPVVSAIDTATGEVRWTKVVDSASGGIAADANGVYLTDLFGNETGVMVALDPVTGEQRWNAEVGYAAYAPMLGDGVLYVWNEANELVAIDSLTGEVEWKRPLSVGGSITTSSKGVRLFQGPAALEGATIAVGALDGTIAAINVSGAPGGEALWSRTYSREISFGFGITGDVIATVLWSSNIDLPASALEAINRTSGATIWRHELGVAGTLLTSKDAFVIAHSASNATPSGGGGNFVLSAYDPATGDERWSLPGISPWQVNSDGTIIFGTTTDEHFLVAISATDGQVLGSLALDKAFYGPAVADEQAVYGRDWSNATVAYSIDALLNGRVPESPMPSVYATPELANTPQPVTTSLPDGLRWTRPFN